MYTKLAWNFKVKRYPLGYKPNCCWFFGCLLYKYFIYMVKYCMRLLMIILWLIFGSLGSVILTRFADGVTRTKLRGFFLWRSKCPHCKHTLGVSDLVPVVSYLVHGGRCRYCGAKISWIYPLLEIGSALIFLGTYLWMWDLGRWILSFWIISNRLFFLLLIYDIQTYELHMPTWILLVVTGVLGNIFLANSNLWNAVFASVIFIWMFLLIYFLAKQYVRIRFKQNREGFGEGDVYLAFIVWLYTPIIFGFEQLVFSGFMITKFLVIFVLMSSIIGLLRAWLQYFLNSKFRIKNSELKIIPFFPAMIIAFRSLARKAHFFITLLFG